jgi:hypothetical protein
MDDRGAAMERASKDVAGVPKARESESDSLPDAELADAQSTDHEAPAAQPDAPPVDELTERERSLLDFEKQWWRHAGAKEQAIREHFTLSPTRYYQVLNALLERPAALAYDPVLVKRLRRVRASRARRRT